MYTSKTTPGGEPEEVRDCHVSLGDRGSNHDEDGANHRQDHTRQIPDPKRLSEAAARDHLVRNDANGAQRRDDGCTREAEGEEVEDLTSDRTEEPEPPERLLHKRLAQLGRSALRAVVHPLLPVQPGADDQIGSYCQAHARDGQRRVCVEVELGHAAVRRRCGGAVTHVIGRAIRPVQCEARP